MHMFATAGEGGEDDALDLPPTASLGLSETEPASCVTGWPQGSYKEQNLVLLLLLRVQGK